MTAPNRAALVERIAAVGRDAAARSSEIEDLRRLPDDLAGALIDTGVFQAWVPTAYGGAQAAPLDVLDAIEELSFHDGATGWCAMIGATSSLASAYLDPAWAARIYGDPRAVTGGYAMPAGKARIADGGLLVDGHWAWGSFSHHCTWLGGGCRVVDEIGTPITREDGLSVPFVFFERDQVDLLDTWRVSGLRGTGSTDYEVRAAFVPEGRWVQFLGGAPVVDAPLYRFPFLGMLALGVATVALGLARRARVELVELAGYKRPAQSRRTLAERPATQTEVARAEARHRSARALIREVVGEVGNHAAAGRELTDEDRRLIRLAATDAVWQAVDAVDLMYHAAGGSSIHDSSALQRVFRDAHVVTQHGMVAARTYEPLGRLALGLSTDSDQL